MITYAKSEFTDISGVDWCIKLVADQAGSDTNLPFNVGPDGFVLSYDFDELDRAKPIVGSRVQFTMFHPEDNSIFFDLLYDLLDAATEGHWQVHIYRDPDGANTLYWLGELVPEQIVIPDTTPFAPVTITAVDGLGNLKGVDYNNSGAAYTGTDTILSHLGNCLGKLQTAGVWTGTDTVLRFFEDFIGDEYKDHIGAGQNQQLNNAKVEHATFHNLDEDGLKRYYSTYDVLESIALSLNASIFISEGVYWLVPLGAVQTHATAMAIYHELAADGTVTYNVTPNTAVYTAFGSGSAIFDKLRGWERTSSPAFKEVKRVRDYQGDRPIVKKNLYSESDLNSQTLLDDEDAGYSSGMRFMVSGTFKYTIDGDGGSSNANRVQLSFKLKLGDAGGTAYYLKRNYEYSDSVLSTASFMEPATGAPGGPTFNNVTYYTHVPEDATWSTLDNTYDNILIVFDESTGIWHNTMSPGGIATRDFQIITPELPAEADGLQLSVEAIGIDSIGGIESSTVSGTADFYIEDLAVHIYDSDNNQQFKEVDITATNSADARYKMDQGTTLVGDNITDNDLGTVTVYDGTNYVNSSEWTNLQSSTANLSINGLGVRERLAANHTPRRMERGTLYRTGTKWISPYTILQNADHSNNYYQVVGLRFIAARSEYDITCMYLSRNITGITVATDNHTRGPNGPSIPPPLPGERVSNVELNTAEIEAYTNRLAGGQFRDGDGLVVAQAELGDDTSTPAFKVFKINPNTSSQSTEYVKLEVDSAQTGSYTFALPRDTGTAGQILSTNGSGTSKWISFKLPKSAIIESHWYHAQIAGRYIPWGNSTAESSSWNYLTIWPATKAGKFKSLALWTQLAGGTTKVYFRKNGSSTNLDTVTLTTTAGNVVTADFGQGASFDEGDEVGIFFDPTTSTYGTALTIEVEFD